MTLDEAARLLEQTTGAKVRPFSTQDFGREQNPAARSVLVPAAMSDELLSRLRPQLGAGVVAFIGTTRWLGAKPNRGKEEIVVGKAKSQFDILRIAQTDAVNYDLSTEDLIAKLTEYDRQYGIDIYHAETDTVEFRLNSIPDDPEELADSLTEFCPDIFEDALGEKIARTGKVFLWWD